ncbi:MAG: hypothetical protein GY847_26035 [Proteobacteria bacterium]|nr:hypothetical protein [Pseudomonadota bacterium]
MTKAFHISIWMVLAGLALLIACNNDKSDGGFDTSVSKSKQLKDLTDEETEQLCKDLRLGFDDLAGTNVECLTESLIIGLGDASKCQQAYDSCVEEADSTLDEDCKQDEDGDDDFDDCEATVGEMIDCFDDSADAYEESFSDLDLTLSCDMSISDFARLELLEEPTRPESCQALDEKCPDL